MSNKDNGFAMSSATAGGVNIGYGNYILPQRIVAILESGSLPTKRLRDRSEEAGLLLDATAGRKTRSLIVLDSRHVVLSALAPQTLQERLHGSHRASPLDEIRGGELVS